jgi:acyl-CoA synthetase (AMP-forming)/AMP-acid ligase II
MGREDDLPQPNDTLIGLLRRHAEGRPDALYARYLFSDREVVEVSYAETLERTRRFAAGYSAAGVTPGDVVLVILEHHEDLMPAFLGATWIGALPAFLPHPNPKTDPDRFLRNVRDLIEHSSAAAVLTREPVRKVLQRAAGDGAQANGASPRILTVEEVTGHGLSADPAPHDAETVALIQYSSGSTGRQKGAMLSHRAILAEIRGVGDFFRITPDDTFVTWVPLYHDWGLVCVALHALAIGTSYTLLSPIDWVRRPVSALEAVSRHRSTIYYHPNFAFNFTAQRVTDEQMEGLDLSSVRLWCNGAEPCFFESHEMFRRRFEPWGLRPDSLGIVYGMAEVTNSVIAAGDREPIVVDPISRGVLQQELRAEPAAEDAPDVMRMLGVGRALEGTEFRIVDDDRRDVPDRVVGEVAIRSRAAMHGYHNNPEATARCLDADGWYYTGDMGYRVGKILFITGRKSDMIIVGGVNIYPQDIEAIVGEHPHAVAGRVAAIGVDDPELGTQKVVLIVESKSEDPEVHKDIAAWARREVGQRLNVVVHRVVHAPYTWLIKTSSGKIARIPNLKRLPELEKAQR